MLFWLALLTCPLTWLLTWLRQDNMGLLKGQRCFPTSGFGWSHKLRPSDWPKTDQPSTTSSDRIDSLALTIWRHTWSMPRWCQTELAGWHQRNLPIFTVTVRPVELCGRVLTFVQSWNEPGVVALWVNRRSSSQSLFKYIGSFDPWFCSTFFPCP